MTKVPTTILQSFLDSETIPLDWEIVSVTPLFKTSERRNYRQVNKLLGR